MDVLKTVSDLFERHSAETLMALFGAVTSVSLLYLVWVLVRYFFGLLAHTTTQEADQEKATSLLMEALVEALVSEAGHLRQTLNGILDESLRCSEQNARVLAVLLTRTEHIPSEILQLLKPEFERLHGDLLQTEARIVSKMTEGSSPFLTEETSPESQVKQASRLA